MKSEKFGKQLKLSLFCEIANFFCENGKIMNLKMANFTAIKKC